MRFFSVKLALLASLAAFGRADDSCNDESAPFAPATEVGLVGNSDTAGSYHCLTRWRTGDTITGVRAWASLFAIEGIKFTYATGDESQWFGKGPEHPALRSEGDVTWSAGEAVEIKVYNNQGQGDSPNAIGKLQIFKNKESIFDVWATKDKAYVEEPVEIDQGAGIILGVEVRAAQWVSNLEFKMLKSKVVDTTLTDIKIAESMEDWTAKQKGMENVDLSSVYFRNDNSPGEANLTYKFANTVTRKTSKSITTESSHTFGVGIEFQQTLEAGVPGLVRQEASLTVSSSYEYSSMSSNAMTEDHDQALTWELANGGDGNMLAPGRAAHCTAWVLSGKFDSDYTGTVQAKLANGGTFNYSTKGKVSSVSYLDAQAKCDEMDVKEIPGGANTQPGTPINGAGINKRAVVFRG